MIMMGLKFMGDVPFRDVYIHALVRDAKGQKMSKSKGNVIDPLLMIDKFGADAFRFSLVAFAAQGRDVRFSEERVEGYRHFINKLWNAARFMIQYASLRSAERPDFTDIAEDARNGWILSRLADCAYDTDRHLAAYRFNEAANSIYQFVWHAFCDWYLELVKTDLYSGNEECKRHIVDTLFYTLEQILLLLHPFMPFVTEELWRSVLDKEDSIMVARYPRDLPKYNEAERHMDMMIDIISGIRSIRGELNINPSLEITVQVRTADDEVLQTLRQYSAPLIRLTKCKDLQMGKDIEKAKGSAMFVRDKVEVYIPIEGLLDLEAEISRLLKEMAKIDEAMAFLNKKLMNEDFLANAPKDVVEKDKARYEELTKKHDKIADNLTLLKAIY